MHGNQQKLFVWGIPLLPGSLKAAGASAKASVQTLDLYPADTNPGLSLLKTVKWF